MKADVMAAWDKAWDDDATEVLNSEIMLTQSVGNLCSERLI